MPVNVPCRWGSFWENLPENLLSPPFGVGGILCLLPGSLQCLSCGWGSHLLARCLDLGGFHPVGLGFDPSPVDIPWDFLKVASLLWLILVKSCCFHSLTLTALLSELRDSSLWVVSFHTTLTVTWQSRGWGELPQGDWESNTCLLNFLLAYINYI